MDARGVANFFAQVGSTHRQRWDVDSIKRLAELKVPSEVFREREWLLQADIALSHARWFLEGLVDPAPYADGALRTSTFVHLFQTMLNAVTNLKPDLPIPEARDLAKALADVAWKDITQRREERIRWTRRTRDSLWNLYGPRPRCYLCGYQFSTAACNRFMRTSTSPVPLPTLVDFTRPRVLERHVLIEIDHVSPLASGGGNDDSNLRLACGWCNGVKSDYGSLYDTRTPLDSTVQHPMWGLISRPRPMWVLRVVRMRGKCEDRHCGALLEDAELFVAPWSTKGALTPPNIRVFCAEHDPWRGPRYLNATLMMPRRGRSAV